MSLSSQTIPRNSGALLHPKSLLEEVAGDLWSQSTRVIPNLRLLFAVKDAMLNGGLIDDRSYLVEYIIQIAASLPNGSRLRSILNAKFIHSLWSNLQHPPLSYLGDTFRYRSADGSDNNITYSKHSVTLGVAGSRYAQTVPPTRPPSNLPEPAAIFEALFVRDSSVKEHPTKVSSSLFHFATIITHDLFYTDSSDITRSMSSSYLDLSPLYGNNIKEQEAVRIKSNGLLEKDTFADRRFLSQPPGVCALLVAFNRFHNYIVQELAIVNESGRFSMPDNLTEGTPEYEKARLKRDNDLFQTGRLVTCGLYVNIVMNDYLRTILNLNRNPVDSDWKLDPREDFNNIFDKEGTPRGIGNQVSVEFNVIYRWHSAISAHDEVWINERFCEILGDYADIDDIPMHVYRKRLQDWGDKLPQKPKDWTFGKLKRSADGTFPDEGLVDILQGATDNVAGAFGARNIPRVLKAIEMQGIKRGREWGLASLNEFRKFFNLEPYSSFTDVNPDPYIAQSLEELYTHPDNIELYPGLIAEATKKPMVPGSGLCPGFTTSYAILSDAVALVRGDRFYAVDFNPSNLTVFGFDAVSSDYKIAGGGVMHKLLDKAFPGWYTENSVYAKYPFTTPEGNAEITDKRLDFSKPGPLSRTK